MTNGSSTLCALGTCCETSDDDEDSNSGYSLSEFYFVDRSGGYGARRFSTLSHRRACSAEADREIFARPVRPPGGVGVLVAFPISAATAKPDERLEFQ